MRDKGSAGVADTMVGFPGVDQLAGDGAENGSIPQVNNATPAEQRDQLQAKHAGACQRREHEQDDQRRAACENRAAHP